jgi:hypothetical protein
LIVVSVFFMEDVLRSGVFGTEMGRVSCYEIDWWKILWVVC